MTAKMGNGFEHIKIPDKLDKVIKDTLEKAKKDKKRIKNKLKLNNFNIRYRIFVSMEQNRQYEIQFIPLSFKL
jgi:hypothetical protein